MMMKILEVLDKYLVLREEIEMACEFTQGLANYKKISIQTFFESLLEIPIKHQSPGNHALASIYLGEVELYWGKHEEAVKYFMTAADEYHTDAVAELFHASDYFNQVCCISEEGIVSSSNVTDQRSNQCL